MSAVRAANVFFITSKKPAALVLPPRYNDYAIFAPASSHWDGQSLTREPHHRPAYIHHHCECGKPWCVCCCGREDRRRWAGRCRVLCSLFRLRVSPKGGTPAMAFAGGCKAGDSRGLSIRSWPVAVWNGSEFRSSGPLPALSGRK